MLKGFFYAYNNYFYIMLRTLNLKKNVIKVQ